MFAQSPRDIIAAADQVRNPGQPFRSTDTLTEYVAGNPKNQDQLVVYAKVDPATRQFRNVVRYVEPPRDAGKMVLLDGHNLWFYDPASKASVRISPQQRLIGQASVGDILTTNFVDRLRRHAAGRRNDHRRREAVTALLAPRPEGDDRYGDLQPGGILGRA